MNLKTIRDQVAFLERQAAALQINAKAKEYIRLVRDVRQLKIQNAEEFFGMPAEDCRHAFYRLQDLVKIDHYSPHDALQRVNVEIAPQKLTPEVYDELVKIITYPKG